MTQGNNWLDENFTGYNVVQSSGVPVQQRKKLNYGAGLTVADDPTTGVTTVSAPNAGAVFGQYNVTLTNGLNSNIATTGKQTLRLGGPSAAFSIGGFTPPAGGAYATLEVTNTTSQPMTIVNDDASSTSTWRIATQTGGDVILQPKGGSAHLFYDSTLSGWVLQNVGVHQPLVFNVRDYGATGLGPGNDDTVAIQATYDAAATTLAAIPNGIYDSGQQLSVQVHFPAPKVSYSVSAEISVKPGIHTIGNHYALLHATDDTFSILRTGGDNCVEDLAFFGGKHHITVYGHSAHYGAAIGTPTGEFPNVCERVLFKYAAQPSVYIDNTPAASGGSYPPGIPNTASSFSFQACVFVGASAFYGCADGVFFDEHCRYQFDATTGAFDDNGKILGFFNSGDHISVRGVGVPSDVNTRYPAWFQGAGIFKVNDFRFGGESATVSAVRLRKIMPYNGLALGLGWSTPSEVYIDQQELTSAGATSWLEIYDEMPRVISIKSGVGIDPYSNINGGAEMVGTWGVFVDGNTVSLSSIINRDVRGLQIILEGTKDINAFRFYWSTNPPALDPTGFVDLGPMIHKHINSHLPPQTSQAPQNNLMLSGIVRATDFGAGQVYNGSYIPNNDTSTGYTLNNIVATVDGGNFSLTTATTWNGGSGEYTLSLATKSSFGGRAIFGYEEPPGTFVVIGMRDLDSSGEWARSGANFFHDGIAKNLFVELFDMPNGGSVTPGLFALHKGRNIHPYTYPVDSPTSPTTNVTTEGLANATYAGSSQPTGGTYIAGDCVVNTNQGTDQPIGWQCVSGGSPGSWKASPFRSGQLTITNPASSAAQTLSPPEYDTNYHLALTPVGYTGAFVTGSNRVETTTKNAGSFVVFVETAPGTTITYDWVLYR